MTQVPVVLRFAFCFGHDVRNALFNDLTSCGNVRFGYRTQRHQETNAYRIGSRDEGHQTRMVHSEDQVLGLAHGTIKRRESNHATATEGTGNRTGKFFSDGLEPRFEAFEQLQITPLLSVVPVFDQRS